MKTDGWVDCKACKDCFSIHFSAGAFVSWKYLWTPCSIRCQSKLCRKLYRKQNTILTASTRFKVLKEVFVVRLGSWGNGFPIKTKIIPPKRIKMFYMDFFDCRSNQYEIGLPITQIKFYLVLIIILCYSSTKIY